MRTKWNIYMFILSILGLASCSVKQLQTAEYYEAGNNILGESMTLHPEGEFEYQRWEDHYKEAAYGTYEWKGSKLLLNTTVLEDSLNIAERIQPDNDSIIVQIEIWDDKFEEKISTMSHVEVALLQNGEVVATQAAYLGRAAFESVIFDEIEFIASGFLLREVYEPQHAKANFFYAQYRFGNAYLEHLHFEETKWRFKQGKTLESIIEEKEQTYKEDLIFMPKLDL